MIFKFSRKRFSDVVKVVEFMDKNDIEYDVVADIEVGIGAIKPTGTHEDDAVQGQLIDGDLEEAPRRKPGEGWITGIDPLPARDPDPLWKPAQHDNKVCTDKPGCKHITHYGAQEL
jgi:hypothetical protein